MLFEASVPAYRIFISSEHPTFHLSIAMFTAQNFILLNAIAAIAFSLPSPHSATWTTLSNITIAPRQEHTTFFLPPSTIGILGGIVPAEQLAATTDLMQFYSIPNNTWTTKASIPRPLNHVNAAVSGGKIYILGGLADDPAGPPAWRGTPESWVYDPETDAWESIAAMPVEGARGSAAVGVYEGKIFLAGGMTALELFEGGQQVSVTTVSIYDTSSGEWLEVPEAAKNIPAARDHSGAAVVGHKMYVLGGRDHGQENVRDTVFILDLRDLEKGWRTSDARMPTPRGGVAAGVIGKTIYTFGGEGNTAVESGVFNQTEAYDTVHDRWEKLAPMKIPRHGTYAVGVGSRVYIPGGGIIQSAGPVVDFDAFTP